MHLHSLVSAALLGAGLIAQGQELKVPASQLPQQDIKTPAPMLQKTMAPAAPAIDATVSEPAMKTDTPIPGAMRQAILQGQAATGVALDQPRADGPIWAKGRNYKASFSKTGWSFLPALGAELPSREVSFRLAEVRVAGVPQQLTAAPVVSGQRVEYRHAGCIEAIDLRLGEVEQTFRFDQLPQRGGISIVLEVGGDLPGDDLGDGVAFHTARGDVSYGEAVAIDAAGNRVHAETSFANGRISIEVPAAFVNTAQLPLVIDPIVASTFTVSSTDDLSNADVAWDETNQVWAVCYEKAWSSTDTDCYVQRLDAGMNAVGSPLTVDFTGDVWQKSKVANNNIGNNFLVVAQVSSDQVAPYWIGGRIVGGDGTVGANQIDIEKAGVTGHFTGDKINPDVGGDPHTSGPTYFCVVWERVISSADHDIHCKLVNANGTLVNASPTAIENSSATVDSHPAISKSDGAPLGADQFWGIVWQHTYSATDEDIYGALLSWSGSIRQVHNANTFGISTSTAMDIEPQISTPAAGVGTRDMVVVFTRMLSGGNSDIIAVVTRTDGTVLPLNNLGVVENNPTHAALPQSHAHVDCDGARFAVTYQEPYLPITGDIDTYVTLLAHVGGGQLVANDSAVRIGHTSVPEFDTSIASRFSASGVRNRAYCIVEERDSSASFQIDALAYDGYGPGGFGFRNTGCGGLTFTLQGQPVLGETFQINLSSNHPLSGVLVGFPTSIPIGPCPGCTLGVNGSAILGNPFTVNVPVNFSLVGATFSFQGFTFASGPCIGTVSLSDTIDATLQ